MSTLKIPNHNAVQFLLLLREACKQTSKNKRRTAFNGLTNALKGLKLIDKKESVEGIFEGIDHLGQHWFMVELKPQRASENVSESANRKETSNEKAKEKRNEFWSCSS